MELGFKSLVLTLAGLTIFKFKFTNQDFQHNLLNQQQKEQIINGTVAL